MNHLAFFGLTREPFRLTPERDFFYPSPSHLAAREVLRFGLDQGEGFLVLTGETGTGKTLLLRLLIADLPKRFETALILSPHLAPRELLLAILEDIGLAVGIPPEASMDQLLRLLNDHLSRLAGEGKKLAVIIDEAQNLPTASLEQLRLLSNFESDTSKLVQIILVGQPELLARLSRFELRQLWQRISVVEQLRPLSRQEMESYIKFRLQQAGTGRLRCLSPALALLWSYSRGLPRLINKALNRALLMAYSRQQPAISREILHDAIETLAESAFTAQAARLRRLRLLLLIMLLTSVTLLLAYLLYQGTTIHPRWQPLLPAWLRELPAWLPRLR